MHGDLCKHLRIDSSTDHPDRYSNLFLYTMYTRRDGGEVQAPPELPMNPPLTLCILFAPVMPKSCADPESFVGGFFVFLLMRG